MIEGREDILLKTATSFSRVDREDGEDIREER